MRIFKSINLLIWLSITLTACSSGGSGGKNLSPAQQFAANVITEIQYLKLNNQKFIQPAFIRKTDFLPDENLVYLLTYGSNQTTNPFNVYVYNNDTWQQHQIGFPESTTVITSMAATLPDKLYFAGYANESGTNHAVIYSYSHYVLQPVTNPFNDNCITSCQITNLASDSNELFIYAVGIDDNGIEIYKFDGNNWILLPAPPYSNVKESAIPSSTLSYALSPQQITFDDANNLYLGARFGVNNGSYQSYLAKYNITESWSIIETQSPIQGAIFGLTYANQKFYLGGTSSPDNAVNYSVISTDSNFINYNLLYNYTYSNDSTYKQFGNLYTDIYGNIYAYSLEQNIPTLIIVNN